MYVEFDTLTDRARIWMFQSTIRLELEQIRHVSRRLMDFLDEWYAHGKNLWASFTILYEHFIVIGLEESSHSATGCSIDKLLHLIQSLEKEVNISLLDRMKVAFRNGGIIQTLDINIFRKGLEKGVYDGSTVVFNNMLETKGQLQNEWEIAVKDSLHKELLPLV